MSGRDFPFATIQRGGQPFSALRIDCGACGTQAFYKAERLGHKERAGSLGAEKHFRAVGWVIGSRAKADRCPDCAARDKPKTEQAEPAMDATKPREMSREERRIIFAKIDELYLEDKKGYTPPWTDSAVARDLGVPRAWVAQVREELFGPEGSNAEFDDFLEKAAPIITDLKNLHRSVAAQLEEARKLAARVDEIERIGRRIEREIGKTAP